LGESVKVSIVTAVLNSPEIARRQILHYNKIGLPDDVEVIFIDDGSDPPLDLSDIKKNFNFFQFATNDTRMWTQPTARNFGVRRAVGDYLILTDIDHIISKRVVSVARKPSYDIIRFSREAAVLDAEGNFTQDPIVLKSWGLMDRYIRRNFKLAPHGNSYIFRRELYLELGGVSERYCGTGVYPNREELPLKQKIKPLWKEGKISVWDKPPKPIIYMMPNGKYCGHLNYNPFGFFHDLDRRNNKQIRKERIAKRASRRTTIKKTNKQVRREREARAKYYNSRQK
jgi:glycosyltransferase involved in cell wall biosynthesis